MSLETALKALMLPSGNDAAYAIAESVGATLVQQAKQAGASIAAADGSTVDLDADDAGYRAFVAAMNAKAGELGCENSLFTNPHGLDDGEWADELHSCASDVAKIVAHAMSDESFRSIVSTDAATIQVTRDGTTANVDLESTDALLGVYEGACGVKTGYTDLAGSCFAGAVSKEGKTLYSSFSTRHRISSASRTRRRYGIGRTTTSSVIPLPRVRIDVDEPRRADARGSRHRLRAA